MKNLSLKIKNEMEGVGGQDDEDTKQQSARNNHASKVK